MPDLGPRAPLVIDRPARRGPKGLRVGDLFEAEGYRWEAIALEEDRRQVVGQLLSGSRVLHRFRSRQVTTVWRRVGRPR